MMAAIQVVYSETYHLLCIYYLFENVKKKAKFKLYDEMVKSFVENFYHIWNSYNEYQFKVRYNQMLIKYKLY